MLEATRATFLLGYCMTKKHACICVNSLGSGGALRVHNTVNKDTYEHNKLSGLVQVLLKRRRAFQQITDHTKCDEFAWVNCANVY